ncbi:MAG: SLAP domain-containing protein [Lactobacillus sp.]|jgi:hypothetical protein|nr:SLAP domain-containing protein [Lactobacillus sp.]MCH4068955.1 SLAP domain-containing protein [Lactobacillus sp.]MCI1303357.1 SLAP domain-containing protein [Lactobacillus sp.]MCI1329433.1 SLAP domain-containing protein [Lactobacillus sp.]MCI1359615.1 SLAP domain-containing protein [Lactobacillus sp.]
MKFTKTLLASSAALALSGAAFAISNQAQAATSLGVVQTTDPATLVYSQPKPSKDTIKKTLKQGTSWKYFIKQNINGETWYNLGGSQWVMGSQLKEVLGNSQSSSKVESVSKDLQGVATVTYRTPIVVWAEPGAHPTGRYLPRNSSWKYFKVVTTTDGESWYNLGGNQWIPERYVNYNQDPHIGHVAPVIPKGTVATVSRGGARVYVGGGTPNETATKRVLPAGSRWKVFDSKNYGVLMFNVGGNQWIRADQVSVNKHLNY